MVRTIVGTWFGAFLLEDGRPIDSRLAPHDTAELAARTAARRRGERTAEEEALTLAHRGETLVTRDRRIATPQVRFVSGTAPEIEPGAHGFSNAELRELLLRETRAEIETAWDPTVPVEAAVRATSDLDRAINLLTERLAAWDEGDDGDAVGHKTEGAAGLTEARRRLAESADHLAATREAVEKALETVVPSLAPNLSALLGPILAAKMIAQAGGLERLARLPASTIQVLGAEKAFFVHLRGKGPPPRHGLLFLHPEIQSATRAQRGRLARALAGKTAIAARLDRAGSPVREELARQFAARASAIRAPPGAGRNRRPAPK